jgi:hypothetical protein
MKCRVVVALSLVGSLGALVSAQVPAGGEFQVNSQTIDSLSGTEVGSDAAGGFVVFWDGPDGSGAGVSGRRYDTAGAPRGSEFRINSYTSGYQMGAIPSFDEAGDSFVSWVSVGQDGDGYGIFGQRYDASGLPRGPELQINTQTISEQGSPSVASDAQGNVLVAWTSVFEGPRAQLYDASGVARGAEFEIHPGFPYDELTSVASNGVGAFVVVWQGDRLGGGGCCQVLGQRYSASGEPRGALFQVSTWTSGYQRWPAVASDAVGNFVVVWSGAGAADDSGIFAQRYDAEGTRRGSEFRVNSRVTGYQWWPHVASDAAGGFVVAWQDGSGQDGSGTGAFARRYDASGLPRGAEFQVNTYTTDGQADWGPSVASDAVGNFVLSWRSNGQNGSGPDIFAQRYGGLTPVAVSLDPTSLVGSGGNGVLEPGESVEVVPSWRNVNGASQSFDGSTLSFTGPPASGVSYELLSAAATYGTVANGATAACSSCYQIGVSWDGSTRPALHWDATLKERLIPDELGQTKLWSLHVGDSFADVPRTSSYYRFVETLLHKGVTGGCSAVSYCPANPVTREQMSVFVLVGKEGAGYLPTACGAPVFGDVPASSPFCRFIEELSRRGVTSGCGGGNYCPTDAVTREQISVFLLHTLDPALSPPACTTPVFGDVQASSPFCRWIEELSRRGITGGCGGGNYCPTDPVTREQMAVFVTATFGLSLYGP